MLREFEKPYLADYWRESACKRYEPEFASFLCNIVNRAHPLAPGVEKDGQVHVPSIHL